MAYRRLGFASSPPIYNNPEVWLNVMILMCILFVSVTKKPLGVSAVLTFSLGVEGTLQAAQLGAPG